MIPLTSSRADHSFWAYFIRENKVYNWTMLYFAAVELMAWQWLMPPSNLFPTAPLYLLWCICALSLYHSVTWCFATGRMLRTSLCLCFFFNPLLVGYTCIGGPHVLYPCTAALMLAALLHLFKKNKLHYSFVFVLLYTYFCFL